eukprot:scaffold47843_cov17-Tisochrysis_lutea.AAC.1
MIGVIATNAEVVVAAAGWRVAAAANQGLHARREKRLLLAEVDEVELVGYAWLNTRDSKIEPGMP